MGQKFTRQSDEWDSEWIRRFNHRAEPPKSFPDLNLLPAELGLKILSNVDAQDLRLVQSIWSHLANDDHLWKRLCYQSWGYCSAYKTPSSQRGQHFWKALFTTLEEGTAHFNSSPSTDTYDGLGLLKRMNVLEEDASEIAEFILNTDLLDIRQVVALFRQRYDILDCYLAAQNYRCWFLPIALRSFFFKLSVCSTRQSEFIAHLLTIFANHYSRLNTSFNREAVLVLCHSLMLLSNDKTNPSIRNKMSKREYIKNTTKALEGLDSSNIDTDYLGHMYDNVYLCGHVAPARLLNL